MGLSVAVKGLRNISAPAGRPSRFLTYYFASIYPRQKALFYCAREPNESWGMGGFETLEPVGREKTPLKPSIFDCFRFLQFGQLK